jgi:vancomycin resistance protein YoaR
MRDAMTTTVDALEPVIESAEPVAIGEPTAPEGETAAARRRSRTWLRVLAGFVLGLVLCVGAAAAALVAWDASYEGRVLPGIHAGGVDLAGMDRVQAEAALEAALAGYADGRIVVRTPAGDVSLAYADVGRRADVGTMVTEALAAGRDGTPAERAIGQVRLALSGRTIGPRLLLDRDAVAAGVAAALTGQEREPLDAWIGIDKDGIHTTHARDGRTFDVAAATATAVDGAARLDAPAEVVVFAPAIAIPPEMSDADVDAARAATERMVTDVKVAFGKKTWKIKAATVRAWLRLDSATDGAIVPTVDPALVEKSLAKVAKAVKREPQSAVFLGGKGGRIVGVAPGRDGRRLDGPATAAAIVQVLATRTPGVEIPPVKAVTAAIPPKLSTDEAVTKAPLMQRLGSWKTWFPVSERNYFGANIWLPAKFIDGTVLSPGERFEWWRAVGPITSARGFGMGGYIAGDHTEPTGAIGGGMCSSSTTLFNAALRAGLQIGARSNHRYYISRYPLGLDATVSGGLGGGQTMSFTNDMKNPVVIRGFRYRAKGLGWVRYEIWGIPDGRTVSIGRPVVSNVRKATTYTVYVSSLPRGVRKQTEYPANGMDVSVSRVVRNRSGRVIHREVYRTHYTLWHGRIEIGV